MANKKTKLSKEQILALILAIVTIVIGVFTFGILLVVPIILILDPVYRSAWLLIFLLLAGTGIAAHILLKKNSFKYGATFAVWISWLVTNILLFFLHS